MSNPLQSLNQRYFSVTVKVLAIDGKIKKKKKWLVMSYSSGLSSKYSLQVLPFLFYSLLCTCVLVVIILLIKP